MVECRRNPSFELIQFLRQKPGFPEPPDNLQVIRYVQIADYPALRCGGTHCAHLNQLGTVIVRSIKQKKDRLRVGYDILDVKNRERGG